jgi:hypothetical protein
MVTFEQNPLPPGNPGLPQHHSGMGVQFHVLYATSKKMKSRRFAGFQIALILFRKGSGMSY